MALKRRRRTEMFTNGMLAHRSFRREPERLGAGAASFKRVLGSGLLAAGGQSGLTLPKNPWDNRVIEARLSRSKNESDTPRAYAVEDGCQCFGVSSQFPNVAPLEL